MSSKKSRLAIWIGILLIGAAATVADVFVFFPSRSGSGQGEVREVEVEGGIGPKRLAARLHEAGIITSPGRFAIWLRLTGGLLRVRAGRFRIRDDLTPVQILDVLSGPDAEKGIRVTIPEGYTLSRIGEALENAGVVGKDDFIAHATNSRVLSEIGITGTTAEGYLFPDTYFFASDQTAIQIIAVMYKHFTSRLAAIGALKPSALKQGVILASIIQAEAQVAEEMPVIAGVYTNRLTDPAFPSHLLQADPTVSYGCEPHVRPRAKSCDAFNGTLTRRQLDDPANPYNTYRYPGLPPGPICAPGLDALRAAFAPAKVPYFFFVAAEGGHHFFSVTLEEHQKAVKRYRQGG